MRTMMDITNKLKPVTYWFNGPEMRSLYSGTEYLYVKDGGFWFKYSTYEGSGSDPIWWDITSQINEGFKEVILEKNRVVDGTYGYSFVVDKNLIPRYRNARSLTKATIGAVDDDFATIWERTDPWGGWFEPDFLVVDDHLIGWFNASEKGLSEIATGERVNFSKGDVVFGHWSKAGRTFQFLVPPGSPKKEQPLIVFYDQINAHGILYMNEGQQFNGDLMLAPFAW